MLQHHAAHPNLACLVQHASLAQSDGLAYIQKRIGEWARGGIALVDGESTQEADRSRALILAMMGVMMFGHVTLAPLVEHALGVDPLSEEVTGQVADLLAEMLRVARDAS